MGKSAAKLNFQILWLAYLRSMDLQFDDSSFQCNRDRVRSTAGTEFRKDALDVTLHGLLCDRQSIRNQFVRIPSRSGC